MKKLIKQLLFSGFFSICASTTALAGSWMQKEDGWHWTETDGSAPVSAWKWIDGNKDGLAECYYFDKNGCLLTNTVTPDGCLVDENGAWIENGIVRQRASNPFAAKALQQEGLKLYQEADQNSSMLPGLDLHTTVTMTVAQEGLQIPAILDLKLKYHDLNTPNMEYWSSTSLSLLGAKKSGTSFYTGGVFYTDQGPNARYKMKIGYQDMTEHLTLNGFPRHFGAFLNNIQIASDQAGNKILLYSSDISSLNNYLDDLCSQIWPSLSDYGFKINQLEGRAVINPEGCFLQEDISLFMTPAQEEEGTSLSMELHIDYNNPGQPVTITPPSTEGFQELIY